VSATPTAITRFGTVERAIVLLGLMAVKASLVQLFRGAKLGIDESGMGQIKTSVSDNISGAMGVFA
jgi:hypothetical protein